MHTPHLRRKFNLYWQKKVAFPGILALLLVVGFSKVQAQSKVYERRYKEFYDDKTVHYGFFFAVPYTRFNVQHSAAFNSATDSTTSIVSPTKGGFRMGLS